MTSPVSPSAAVIAALRAAGCVFAEDEAAILAGAAGDPAELDAMVARRASGVPLEHVVGWAEFCGLRIVIRPAVFVPRQRTAFLVREAVAGAPPRPVVVDLCCGSGAVAAALAARLGPAGPGAAGPGPAATGLAELHAADLEPAAVACARENLAGTGARVHEGDLYAALPAGLAGRVDILAANVPYVPTGSLAMLPSEARDHEPRLALDGGNDGLDVARRAVAGAPAWLAPGGRLLIETTQEQAPVLAAAVTAAGLDAAVTFCEDLDATVVTGTMVTGTGVTGTGRGPATA
jgi:release factor glutamine methyltransferase